MGRVVIALVSFGIVLGIMWGLNACTATRDNITCKQQSGVAGDIRYRLCVAGQGNVYVPYSVWNSARVGGYYDKGTRTAYDSSNDDPHVSHGLFDRDGDDGGHSVHVGGDGDG